MLKIYNTLDEVPEALREHYIKSDGKYVPQLSDDHPVLTHNKTLLSEKATVTAKVRELEADIAAASEKSIPRGHIAVPKADAELLDKYKAHGTPDEVGARLTEHKSLSEQVAKSQRDQSLRQLAKDHQYNEDAFIRLPNLPEFVSRPSKDGKSTEWFAQIKDDKGVITEKPAKEFVESSPDIQPFMSSLTQRGQGVQVPGSVMVTNPPAGDPFKWARDFGENWNKSQPKSDVAAAFGITKTA